MTKILCSFRIFLGGPFCPCSITRGDVVFPGLLHAWPLVRATLAAKRFTVTRRTIFRRR